jgi:hypothetical protein
MDRWTVPLSIVAATGDVTQLYPTWAPPGTAPGTATPANQVRMPCEGQLISLQVQTDGNSSMVLEIWDVSGIELGIDVSSAATITDAQIDAAVAAGKARLIFTQNIAGSGLTPIAPVGPAGFVKGLAARASGASGTCILNLVVHGGYRYIPGSH